VNWCATRQTDRLMRAAKIAPHEEDVT